MYSELAHKVKKLHGCVGSQFFFFRGGKREARGYFFYFFFQISFEAAYLI